MPRFFSRLCGTKNTVIGDPPVNTQDDLPPVINIAYDEGVADDAVSVREPMQLDQLSKLATKLEHGTGVEKDVPAAIKIYQEIFTRRAEDGGEALGCQAVNRLYFIVEKYSTATPKRDKDPALCELAIKAMIECFKETESDDVGLYQYDFLPSEFLAHFSEHEIGVGYDPESCAKLSYKSFKMSSQLKHDDLEKGPIGRLFKLATQGYDAALEYLEKAATGYDLATAKDAIISHFEESRLLCPELAGYTDPDIETGQNFQRRRSDSGIDSAMASGGDRTPSPLVKAEGVVSIIQNPSLHARKLSFHTQRTALGSLDANTMKR